MSGFTGLCIVFSIISQIYDIDLQINSIIQRKMAMNRVSEVVGLYNCRAINAPDNSLVVMRYVDFSPHYNGQPIQLCSQQFVNPVNGVFGPQHRNNQGEVLPHRFNGPLLIPNPNNPNQMIANPNARPVAPLDILIHSVSSPNAYVGEVLTQTQHQGQVSYELALPGECARYADGTPLGPGERFVTKKQAEEMYKLYLRKISSIEKELDMKLESLRSKRTALVSQKDEFQKYIAEGIKTTFKNAYA